MNSRFFILFGFLSCCSLFAFSQDYHPPVDFKMLLSGTFGELRGNHFHSGIDIKTEGVEGQKVYSIADGYISRIKVSTWGYGKALYITHPDGNTSVYAHLQKFAEAINDYVIVNQYKKEKWLKDSTLIGLTYTCAHSLLFLKILFYIRDLWMVL